MAATTATWYRGTNQTSSGTYFGTVGYDGSPIVGRFAFTTPATGATSISFSTGSYSAVGQTGSGSLQNFRFSVTTDSTAYINRTSASGFPVAVDAGANIMASNGPASVQLLPNTTYYLWIYPAESRYGVWKITSVSVTLSGAYGNPASPTASNGHFGAAVGITLSGGSSGASYTVTTSCAGRTETLQTKGTSTYLSWTPALAVYGPLLPNASSAAATITVETFYGSTSRGTRQTSITLSFRAADVSPTASDGWYSHVPYNASAGSGINKYIQGISRARFSFDSSKISAKYAATIASYSVTVGNATDSASPYETPVLNGATAVTVKITDSRGFSYSTSVTITPLSYAAPTLGQVNVFRCDANGDEDEDGTYYSVTAAAVYSSLEGENSASILRYQKAPGGSYGSGTAYTSGATVLVGPVDADTVYEIKLEISDTVGSSGAVVQKLPSRKWAMKFRPNGEGVGFGMSPQADKRIEIPSDWLIYIGAERVPCELGSNAAGNYAKFAGGLLIQWGTVDPGAHTLSQIGSSGIYFDNIVINFPIPFADANTLITGNSRYSTGHCVPFGAWAHSGEGFTAHIYDFFARNGSSFVIRWFAVGRWK